MLARIAARWAEQDLRRRLRIAGSASDDTRHWIAPKLRARADLLVRCRADGDGALPLAWLEERLAGDRTMRGLALRNDVRPDADPRCLLAAIAETWTVLLIYEARGAIGREKVLAAEREIATAFRYGEGLWSDPNSSPA